jgi:hypothetical protein
MAAEDDGLAAVGQGQDQVFHLAAADGVEAGRRFIEDDEVGIIDQGLGQADAALHAFGELADLPALHFVQAHHFEELRRARARSPGGRSNRLPKKSRVSRESR